MLNLNAWRKVKALGPPHRDPNVESKIPAPLNPGKPLLRRPGPYVAGAVVAAVAVFIGIKSADTGGCLDDQTALGNRMTTLHNAFVEVYNRDSKAIDACQSVDCEKAPKLEIAASLKTYSDGLGQICWPDKDKVDATEKTTRCRRLPRRRTPGKALPTTPWPTTLAFPPRLRPSRTCRRRGSPYQ